MAKKAFKPDPNYYAQRFDYLVNKTKKGATGVDKDGKIYQISDFKRGEAMGKLKADERRQKAFKYANPNYKRKSR